MGRFATLDASEWTTEIFLTETFSPTYCLNYSLCSLTENESKDQSKQTFAVLELFQS